ncbi:MAG TPA: DEAD/DEAH box helicase [Actinomycetota bacterium]|nr:DEAD/DEAH box helicase [Actinomycetota bacterium]
MISDPLRQPPEGPAPLPGRPSENSSGSLDAAEFAAQYPFELDDFQVEALEALGRMESVLVAAPTGSGKTVVAEFALWLALREGRKAFYTTPLKALSNQKFNDFVALHGAGNVGLLTGDNAINPTAPIVVMTTEVLRNMIYERSELLGALRYVVLDEVHYLQDPYRGAVWEEVIIHLPLDVVIVSLSATVSNAEEFADWIQTLRGPTAHVIEERRPVRLEAHYLLEDQLLPMFVAAGGGDAGDAEGAELVPNPEVRRLESRFETHHRRPRDHRHGPRPRRHRPSRSEVVDLLSGEGLLPAIYFIFSRKGCDAAVAQCMRDGLRLTDAPERNRIRELAERRCARLSDEDLSVLGYHTWLEALLAGVAAHHAGHVPVFKETVEELFQAGLIKAVFATETLSLGINMPARTVVIESLTKFTGERHEMMTAGEFTQLTGRAGRRGIDALGHAVVLRQTDIPFQQIAGLASTRTYPLVSSFQPSYNMATNLVRNYSQTQAEHLLNSSFAQYHADKDVVVLERLIERNEGFLESYREKMQCDRGDFAEYWRLRERSARLERSLARWQQTEGREQTRNTLAAARPGQVYVIPTGKMRGPVVVVGVERSKRGEPRLLAITAHRRLIRLTAADFPHPPRPAGNLPLSPGEPSRPKPPQAIDQELRKRLASALEGLHLPPEAGEPEPLPEEREGGDLSRLRSQVLSHPCQRCPDLELHGQWAARASRLEAENEQLRKRVRGRSETISRKFHRVLEVLEDFGYVSGFELSDKGWTLAHIYNEADLLVAETLMGGWLDGLDPGELAALVSTFVFESRGPFEVVGSLPTAASRRAYALITRQYEKIRRRERRAGLELTRGTEAGFAEIMYRWCGGVSLEEVLTEEGLTAGDFIRTCKQTIDLLRQLRDAAGSPELAAALGKAVDGLNRGVVALAGAI